MSLWEYKVITSGKGGFATPALLEKFLNDLGRDQWEIIDFRAQPDNMLAFSGLARRPTQRDWTLEDAAAAAAKVEAEKLRAEFEAKFKAATVGAPAATEERAPSFLEEKAAPDDGFRKPVDTSHDADPDAEEAESDDWDKLTAAEEDELPTFFEAIKPHMRRNQRGPGMSVGADYLAKKWDQSEEDVRGALAECGFEIPADEDAPAVYVEYDGDLYWLNINRRGELWINTKEKPRPVFRAVKAQRVTVEEAPKPEAAPPAENRPQPVDDAAQKTEEPAPKTEAKALGPDRGGNTTLPQGPGLLDKIRPHMRRNRRGPGGSGSTTFLSRALRCSEADLKAAFVTLGLVVPAGSNEKPVFVEFGNELWWLNADSRGGLWINGREKKPGETALNAEKEPEAAPETTAAAVPTAEETRESAPESASTPEPVSVATPLLISDNIPSTGLDSTTPAGSVLAAVRLLLKETRTGSVAGRIDRLAEELGRPAEEFVATLAGAGLKVPDKPREKPVFVEHAGEIFWLNKNAKDELWLNAKASKFAEKKEEPGEAAAGESGDEGEKKNGRRPGRSRKPAE